MISLLLDYMCISGLLELRHNLFVCLHGVFFHLLALCLKLCTDILMTDCHDLQCQICGILGTVDRNGGNRDTEWQPHFRVSLHPRPFFLLSVFLCPVLFLTVWTL